MGEDGLDRLAPFHHLVTEVHDVLSELLENSWLRVLVDAGPLGPPQVAIVRVVYMDSRRI